MNQFTEAPRRDLVAALASLPYAQQVNDRLPSDAGIFHADETEFLDLIRTWVRDYAEVVANAKATTAQMAEELAELRQQRAAIRSFLGLLQTGAS